MYLLDTNFCIAYLRGKNQLVRNRFAQYLPSDLRICSVVLSELYFGAMRSTRPSKHRADVDHFSQPLFCLPFDEIAAEFCAEIRLDLEKRGTPIGAYDLQIAAIALSNGCRLVTHNTSEFGRVTGLAIEDWELP